MIHAQLIVGGRQSDRLVKAKEIIEKNLNHKIDFEKGHPDLLLIEPAASIGITTIRGLQKKLALKPYSSPLKAVLINQARKLTIPAQNALLKTLEEPPAKSLIILTTAKADFLLPTIVSRCQLINLPAKIEIKLGKAAIASQRTVLINILKRGVGERIKLAEKLTKNRDQAIEFCQHQLLIWREILLAGANSPSHPQLFFNPQQVIQTINTIQKSLTLLEANVNPRLVIESLLLSFPSQK
jgi:hypothetical protein